MSKILVTGAAGFIGFHVAARLLDRGDEVVGFDNLSPYYDVALKQARLALLDGRPGYSFIRGDLADGLAIRSLLDGGEIDRVVSLAAQPGVRYSLEHPESYIASNLVGFANLLEACRHAKVRHLVYASSSSVYGANTAMPFSEHGPANHPMSLYAATKRANELMAHAYSSLFGLPTTGLRFFTVYGPWGRPDMAVFSFTKSIIEGRPIDVFGGGDMERDFTYVDDVVEGVVRTLDHPPGADPTWDSKRPDAATSYAPYRVYNIGNHTPVGVLRFIEVLEGLLGRNAQKNLLPMQPGDVQATFADVADLHDAVGFQPATPLEEGLARFVRWYVDFYDIRDGDAVNALR